MSNPKDWYTVTTDSKQIKKERERARKFRKSQWWLNKVNQGICYYCKKKFEAKNLTMDHIVPLARGGKSTHGNIVVACRACNAAKKLETPVEALLKKLEST